MSALFSLVATSWAKTNGEERAPEAKAVVRDTYVANGFVSVLHDLG
jgi:hypothetical protein